VVAAVVVLAGCNGLLGLHDFTPSGDGGGGGSSDGGVATGDSMVCVGNAGGMITVCLDATRATTPATVMGTIDTDSCATGTTLSQAGGALPELCVIAGTTVTLAGATTVTGARPLVLVAVTHLEIDSKLDASAKLDAGDSGSDSGPAEDPACHTVPGSAKGTAGAGGGGGSFGTTGGDGGATLEAQLTPPGVSPFEFRIRGGCPGAAGGDEMSVGALGGAPGGAVYLLAGQTITTTAVITANGGGGVGGAIDGNGGGGGGGTGGLIGLDAPMVSIGGDVVANGGGGGGGGTPVAPGGPGAGGADSSNGATGGTTAGEAGAGGDGNAGGGNAVSGESSDANDGGGGGGGGGGGVVFVNGKSQVSGPRLISPPQIGPQT
jgi:hypothetical protein